MSRIPMLGRRQTLQLAAGTAAAWSLGLPTAAQAAAGAARDQPFDGDWRFTRGDPAGAEGTEYDDGGWRSLDLPHDWSIEDLGPSDASGAVTDDPALWTMYPDAPTQIGPFLKSADTTGSTAYTVGGVGWYRKHFRLDDLPADRQVSIRFDGVYQAADIYLNGTHLGFHPYGYTSFAYDLSSLLDRNGNNVLAVRVANVGRTSRWYSGSGIYRHVWLTTTGPVRIPLWGVNVVTSGVSAAGAGVAVTATVDSAGGAADGITVRVELLDPAGQVAASGGGTVSVPDGGSGSTTVSLSLDRPALWSPDTPSVYAARVSLLSGNALLDQVEEGFGVRNVVIDPANGLFLNGQPLKMKGACVHHTNGVLGAKAIDRAEIRRVEQLKANGFNAVRTSHNPPSSAFMDACDRLGLLVYEEIFDAWDVGKNPQDYSLYFKQYWPTDVSSMVLRDRNRPSVVLWSVGNEIPDGQTPTGGQYGQAIHDLIKQLDPTRTVTCGGNMSNPTLQFQGPEYQYSELSDFHYQYAATYEKAHALHPDKAVISSESLPGSAYDAWTAIETLPYAIGDFVWTGIDYLGESGIANVTLQPPGSPLIEPLSDPKFLSFSRAYPAFQSYCGDVDLVGEKKPQSYYRDVLWGRSALAMFVRRPTPAGTVQEASAWGWPDELASWTWAVPAGQPLTVDVFTAGDAVALVLNGRLVGEQAVTTADKLWVSFTVPYQPGELLAVALKGGQVIGTALLGTVGAANRLLLLPDRPLLMASRDDLSHVLATVVDDIGRRIPDAVAPVSFAVDGVCELAAVGNANPNNIDSFQGGTRETYHGAALAVVRPLGRPGLAILRATAPGLQAAEIAFGVH